MDKIVGIGEYAISNRREDIIKTFALASCVAVTAYSPSKGVAGMVHIALPSPPHNEDSSISPGYYAVTGVPLLINKMCTVYGCTTDELKIGLYGGANSIREDIFKIGKKNVVTVKNILQNMNLLIDIAEIGNTLSRTLAMDVSTGKVKITLLPITI
ncbi:MAG: archease [Clostridiaceae bacterium BRH_c20a]|nr:MAG: archease [Clostridiaceae bacterium BRH_c20a]